MSAAHRALPDWLLSRPIAHRGLHDNTNGPPENSLAAISAGIAAGCPLELDIRLLADGRAVIFHDGTVGRMTGRRGRLGRFRTADLPGLTLLGTQERVPLLSEALAAVGGAVPLLLEIKCETPWVRRVTTAAARELESYPGAYAVQSFNPFVLRRLRRIAPHTTLGLLSGWRGGGALARLCRPDALCQEVHWLGDASVQRARRAGLPLLAWVVRDAETRRLAGRLADNYIFEGEPEGMDRDPRSDF